MAKRLDDDPKGDSQEPDELEFGDGNPEEDEDLLEDDEFGEELDEDQPDEGGLEDDDSGSDDVAGAGGKDE
jgi:hypothetical protein